MSAPKSNDPQSVPPRDLEWVARHWKTLAAMSAVLAAAGYTVISPSQKVDAIGVKIDRVQAVQQVRDSVQDVRIDRIQARADTELRDVREGIEDLKLAECLRSRDAAVRARLRCGARLHGMHR